MKIIHTSDFKNNTILAERGIKCVIRGYAFVNDTKKWLEKKYADAYAFEDITLEELCDNCVLVTDEDKHDSDILNNLFDVTFEPCLELTVPETTDDKGTVLGGEKFGTYKIRINSALNNKTRNGIMGTYRAIVLIGEKYTEDKWHVITQKKSYIAMWIWFGAGDSPCFAEKSKGLVITKDTAFTINVQFSLSQLGELPSPVELDEDYAEIMKNSNQKDQTTIKLDLPGAFLVPSGKEYKTRVELENGKKIENEGIAYMDKTLNLIPNTYKNNNIFNVTPRVNIFDEHDDKFVKPQLLLSYGGKTSGDIFAAQSIGFEYDPSYFKMNEKAPTAATRIDLFGGATKRENANYDDSKFDQTSGYMRLLCDRGYHEIGENDLFIKSNDNTAGMFDGSMILSEDNRIVTSSYDTHVIDSRGTSASAISGGLIIDSEKIFGQDQFGLTAIAAQRASAFTATNGYDPVSGDVYRCPDCDGTGKIGTDLYFVVIEYNGFAYDSVVYKEDDTFQHSGDIGREIPTNYPNPRINVLAEEVANALNTGDPYIDPAWGFTTLEDAEAFAADVRANCSFAVSNLAFVVKLAAQECSRCGGDGHFGAYGLPGRLSMMGLNVSSVEFNGYNNFFIGHKGLLSNFGHDAVVFGNHNACGNKEYEMCEHCEGTGRILCTTCTGEDGRPRGVVTGHPTVTCSSCYGFGYVNYSADICTNCSGKGYLNDDPSQVCPICLGKNSHSGVNPDDWEGFYTCQDYVSANDAIYECRLCSGKKEIIDTSTTAWLPCPDCSGYGQMIDPDCGGLGYIESYEHAPRYSACPTCHETLMTCTACSGQGYTGDDPTIPCELCGGDKQVCSTCSGTGGYECPECHGTQIVECPECVVHAQTALCPLCSGLLVEPDPASLSDDGNISWASTDNREKILAWLPTCSGMGDRDSASGAFSASIGLKIYASLVKNPCTACEGTGIDENTCYGEFYEVYTDEDGEHNDLIGFTKQTERAPTWVPNFEDATIYTSKQTCSAQTSYVYPYAPHGGRITKTLVSIPKVCEHCGGGGGYDETNHTVDKRIICPCCNKLFTYTTSSRPDVYKVGPTTAHSVDGTYTYSAMYRDMLSLANNRYCGTPGYYYKVKPNVGYHECDLCHGTQVLTWDQARELEGWDEEMMKNVIGSRPESPLYHMILVGEDWYSVTGGKADGMICPKCMNMKPLKSEVDYQTSHSYNSTLTDWYRAFSGINMHDTFSHENMQDFESNIELDGIVNLDGGYTAACDACNYRGTQPYTKWGQIKCPTCVEGIVPCDACDGVKHWLCPTCSGEGKVKYRPIVAYEDGGVVKVGDGYFYKNLMSNQQAFNLYDDYINIKPENNCDLDIGQYLKRMNVFSVENHGMLLTHNNNYDEIPDSNVTHREAVDFFAVRNWAKYDSLSERFANLQNGCYSPDTIYFTKRTAHNEQWKLRIRELDYLIHDNYIKTNASMLKTAALNKAISDFYKKNTSFLLTLGPIITYRWDYIKGSKGAKGTKGWKGRKGIKGVTLGLKGKKGLAGLKGLKGTKGYKGMELKILDMRYKFYIEDILKATQAEFGRYISNNGNLGKNPNTYTFYCVNGDPKENLYFKGVRLRKMSNGNYQTLNAVKGIRPAEVQRILYKDNGYYGEYGVMNFNYAYNNKFLT